jgi:hypothetical protein
MRLSYDATADAAYLYLADEIESVAYTVPCDPREVAGMINVDSLLNSGCKGASSSRPVIILRAAGSDLSRAGDVS